MMEIRRYIIACIMLLLFSSVGAVAQILIDGVGTRSVSGEICGEKHTLECVLPSSFGTNNYCMWQRSDDDGATWTNMPQSGQNVYSIEVSNDNGGKQLYHLVLTTTLESALGLEDGPIVVSDDVSLECNLSICGDNENRLVVWKEDFKSTPRGERRECADVQNRKFAGQYNLEYATNINNNMYAIVSHSEDGSIPQYNWFSGGTDHTGNKDGGFLLINNPDGVGSEHTLIFEKKIDFDLCPDTWYYFSMYAMCVTGRTARNPNSQDAYPNFMFEIIGEDGTVLESGLSGEVPVAAYGISTWINYGISFNAGNNKNVILRIYDDAKKGIPGDDMAIDDISLIACQKEVPATNLNAGLSPDADGICGDSTTLTLSEMSQWEKTYPNVYVVWQKSLDGGFTWITIPGASGEKSYSLRAPFEESVVGVRYRAVIAKDESTAKFIAQNGYSNDACSIFMITNVSTLTCHCEIPEIALPIADTSFCYMKGDSLALSVSVTNDVKVDSFCWMYRTEPDVAWTLIPGKTGSDLMVSPTELTHYAVYAVNGECVSDTDSCVVRVKAVEVTRLRLEGKDSICEQSSSVLSLNLPATTEVFWRVKKAGLPIYSPLTTDGPSIEVTPGNGDAYYAVTGADPQTCERYVSDTVTFYVEDSVKLSQKYPEVLRGCIGTAISLSASINQNNKIIGSQWAKRSELGYEVLTTSGVAVDTPTVSCEYIISYFSLVCPPKSDSVWLEVVPMEDLTLTASADVICENGEVTLTASYGASKDIVWQRMVKGATEYETFSTELTETLLVQPSSITAYRIHSKEDDVCPVVYSDVVIVDVEDSIRLSVQPESQVIEEGESVHLEASVSGDAASFVWKKKLGSVVDTLDTGLKIDDTPIQDCDYVATAAGKGCPDVSRTVHVTLKHPSKLSLSISADTVCLGESATLLADFDNVSDFEWLSREEGTTDFVTADLTGEKENLVSPLKTTDYMLKEVGKDNYSNIVTLYVEQPLEVALTGADMVYEGGEVTLQYQAFSNMYLSKVLLLESNADTTVEYLLVGSPSDANVDEVGGNLTFSPTKNTEYTLVANASHCPEKRTSHTVTVTESPNYSLTISADTICKNGEVVLTASYGNATDIVWERMTEGSVDFETFSEELTQTLTVQPDSKTVYRIRSLDGGVAPVVYSEPVTVVVEDSIRVKVQPSSVEIREGECTQLKATIFGGVKSFVWKKKTASSEELLSDQQTVLDVCPDFDGEYILETSGKACPGVKVSVPVDVFRPGDLLLSISTDSVCVGGEATLSTDFSDASNLVWLAKEQGSDDFVEIADFASNPQLVNRVAPEKTTRYKIQERNTDNVSNEVTLYVEQPSVVELTGTELICPDGEVTLQYHAFSNMGLYKISLIESNADTTMEHQLAWDALTMGNEISSGITTYPKGETEYTLVVGSLRCPEQKASHRVKMYDIPKNFSLSASADTVCQGEMVYISTDFPFSERNLRLDSWHTGDSDYASESIYFDSSSVECYPNVGINRFDLIARTEGGCYADTLSVNVTVLGAMEDVTVDTTICAGESSLLYVNGQPSGRAFVWSSSSDFSDTIVSGEALNVTLTGDTTYYAKAVDDRCGVVYKQNVHAFFSPEIAMSGPDIVCPGSEFVLFFSASSLIDVPNILMRKSVDGNVIDEFEVWNVRGLCEGVVLHGEHDDSVEQKTEYTLVLNTLYCPAKEVSVEVDVAEVPTDFTFTVSADTVCYGEPVMFSTDFPLSDGNLKLNIWSPMDDHPAESIVMTAASEYVYPHGDIRCDLIAHTDGGCFSDTLSLYVVVSQPVEYVIADTTVCEGEPALLRLRTSEQEEMLAWSTSPDLSDTVGVGDRVTVSPNEDSDYYVRVKNGKCVDTLMQTVHVVPLPSIELETEGRAAICSGVGGSGNYLYDLGSGFSTVNKLDYVVPAISYTFTVKDEFGCMADTTFMAEYEALTIPEFFTPQGDGFHDVWEIDNLDKYEHVKVSVFDRFGKKLFETEDPEFSWDGTYNGNPLPSDDYWYTIYVKDIDRFFKGHFTLIRSK